MSVWTKFQDFNVFLSRDIKLGNEFRDLMARCLEGPKSTGSPRLPRQYMWGISSSPMKNISIWRDFLNSC